MEHHYPAWETVLQIDFLMVGVAVAATTFLAWQRRPLAQARAQVGALIILFGLWVHASLFVVDLFAIIFLPDQVGVEGAMVFIHRLHDEHSWYVNAGAAVLIFTGLAITIRRLTNNRAPLYANARPPCAANSACGRFWNPSLNASKSSIAMVHYWT